jgi:hypothetical protein
LILFENSGFFRRMPPFIVPQPRTLNRLRVPEVTHFNPGFADHNPCLVGWVGD